MKCPSCHSQSLRRKGVLPEDFRFAGRELRHLMGNGHLVACARCHLYFRWPQPDADSLSELYRKGNINHWQYEGTSRFDWETTAAWIRKHHSGGKLLDVGCFDGAFLRAVGSNFSRFGVEPHPEAVQRATDAGIVVVGDTLEDVDAAHDGSFDCVTAFDVVEHLSDPASFVARAHSLLRPGGSLVFGTGNTDSPTWRFMGSRYWYSAVPEHLSFINRRWVHYVAHANQMSIAVQKSYSHVPNAPMRRRLAELARNLICRTAPPIWRRLRAGGFGGIPVSLSERLRDYPPQWMTAEDHILVVLQK